MIEKINTVKKAVSPITLFLVLSNVIVFIILSCMGDTTNADFMLSHGAFCYQKVVWYKEYYRLFTSMFMHFGFPHLVYNMLALFCIGDMIEKFYGKICYLLIYIGGGLAGNILSLYLESREAAEFNITVEAGASGAVFALVGALILYVLVTPRVRNSSFAKRAFLMAFLLLAEGFTQSGVSNSAHIGGFIGGFLISGVVYAAIRVISKK